MRASIFHKSQDNINPNSYKLYAYIDFKITPNQSLRSFQA